MALPISLEHNAAIFEVTAPYVKSTRESLEFVENHTAWAIFDVFTSHHSDIVLEVHGKYYVFIPAGCTGEHQPLT